ncbi:MAG: tyrosine-protein phosphatase [Acidimicrobiales bacterium]
MAPFDGVVNFREMGGMPAAGGSVRHGRLFRSGHWSQASDADVATLAQYNMAAIVDFRTDLDRTGDGGPNRIPDGPEYLKLEMVDTGGNGELLRTTLMSGDQALIDERFGGGKADKLAATFVTDLALEPAKQQVFSRFLQVASKAANDDRPVLWHCSAGKDRAGWAATLLGMALGIDDDAIVEHYVASNIHRPVESRLAHYAERGIDAEAVRPFLMVHEKYLRAGLAAVDERWPTRETYLEQALGLSGQQIEQLRHRLID